MIYVIAYRPLEYEYVGAVIRTARLPLWIALKLTDM